ncbi:MAG: HAMP domain-containing histidine kinase [Lachnospiraceae bacterium]|nr:HAMP domain-containing histidine kinase [Lachnospiraceae bacterium]
MAIKWKSNKTENNSSVRGMVLVLILCMLASTVMCNFYPYFRSQAKANIFLEKTKQEHEASLRDMFYVDSDFERYLLSSIYYMNYELTPNMDAYDYFTQNYEMSRLTAEEQESVMEASARLMRYMRNQYTTVQSMNDYASYARGVERSYGTDSILGEAVYGNVELGQDYFSSGLVISYDSRGIPSVRDHWNMTFDEAELLGDLRHATMSRLMEDNGMAYETLSETEAYHNDELLKQLPLPMIQNATFVFGIHRDTGHMDQYWNDYYIERNAYQTSGYAVGMIGIILTMAVLAVILQNIPVLRLRTNPVFCLPTELLIVLGSVGVVMTFAHTVSEFGMYTLTSDIVDDCRSIGFGDGSGYAATVLIGLFWTVFAFGWYWLTASVLPYITHPLRTLKEQMLICVICRWCKRQWLRFWHWGTDIELDENLTRNIWKLVAVNGVIVGLLCCIWFGGVVGAVIYSIILYVIVKKKCAQIQGDYQKLLHVTKRIADGDLNTEITEDMGLLNPVRDELVAIQSGFRKAVHEEVRSRNMKTELITNVSHDLKTPLTAIITYVDLLKKEDITEEERRAYVETLDKKSQRLKVLIEDLFEVSKVTTNNITLNLDEVDLVNLIKQVRLENEDKIEESTLDIRWNLPEVKCMLTLDPQKTYRIIDNLLQNILKYSMPHSRVYIELKVMDGEVIVSFKNMSAAEMNFSAEEITERFVRGDLSRNTEGSGLGLAIAQSFTELQNGRFQVEIDGDLFKVTLVWKR